MRNEKSKRYELTWDKKVKKSHLDINYWWWSFQINLTCSIPRYLFPIIPFMLIWVAKGTYELQRWFERSGYQKIIKNNIATILVLISLFPPFIAYYSFFLSDQPIEYKNDLQNFELWLRQTSWFILYFLIVIIEICVVA